MLYIIFLIFCNVLIPCLLYYLLRNRQSSLPPARCEVLTLQPGVDTSLSKRAVVGISSSALGLSSCFDGPFRLSRRAFLLLSLASGN